MANFFRNLSLVCWIEEAVSPRLYPTMTSSSDSLILSLDQVTNSYMRIATKIGLLFLEFIPDIFITVLSFFALPLQGLGNRYLSLHRRFKRRHDPLFVLLPSKLYHSYC